MPIRGISARAAMVVACGCLQFAVAGCSSGGPSSGPQADREWAYHGQRGITAVLRPTDRALYRALLPTRLEMPESLSVVVAVVSYDEVTAPLTPYREGYVLLSCRLQGQVGWYVLTMPVDDQTANGAGQSIGFPKYVADRIELAQSGETWSGEVVHQGRTVLRLSFAPQGPSAPASTGGSPSPPCFNVMPSAAGSEIVEVDTVVTRPQSVVATEGTASVASEVDEPWVELVKGATAVSAQFAQTTGEWILEWKKL